jgi:hypothetical protein
MSEIPDTNDFILDIRKSDGEIIYKGDYGASPETLFVDPGNYTVSALSEEFTKPGFDTPQYGASQVVVVPPGRSVSVKLNCRQTNCGLKLNISPDFLTSFPGGVLFVKSDEGKMMYGYSERRIAFFNPGVISVVLNDSGKDNILFSRDITAGEILTMGISSPSKGSSSGSSGISISVDTTREWSYDSYEIGGSGSDASGSDSDNALSVSKARDRIGEENVWVYGYIVGGDLTSAGISFSKPFKSNTNFAIATRSSVKDKNSCMSVQLCLELRDGLNLADHPEYVGRRVYLQGDIVDKYFGIPGIKNITDYRLK